MILPQIRELALRLNSSASDATAITCITKSLRFLMPEAPLTSPYLTRFSKWAENFSLFISVTKELKYLFSCQCCFVSFPVWNKVQLAVVHRLRDQEDTKHSIKIKSPKDTMRQIFSIPFERLLLLFSLQELSVLQNSAIPENGFLMNH